MTKSELLIAVAGMPDGDARLESVMRALKGQPAERRKPGTIRQAAAILECNPRTVHRYAAKGLLTQIRLSPRRVRYDLNEVTRLSEYGTDYRSAENGIGDGGREGPGDCVSGDDGRGERRSMQ